MDHEIFLALIHQKFDDVNQACRLITVISRQPSPSWKHKNPEMLEQLAIAIPKVASSYQ